MKLVFVSCYVDPVWCVSFCKISLCEKTKLYDPTNTTMFSTCYEKYKKVLNYYNIL